MIIRATHPEARPRIFTDRGQIMFIGPQFDFVRRYMIQNITSSLTEHPISQSVNRFEMLKNEKQALHMMALQVLI